MADIHVRSGAVDPHTWSLGPATGSAPGAPTYRIPGILDYHLDTVFEAHTPEMHGAVGDGVTDDRAALQAAMNAAITGKGVVILKPGKTYNLSRSVEINNATDVHVLGYGAKIIHRKTGDNPSTNSVATTVYQAAAGFLVKNSSHIVLEGFAAASDGDNTVVDGTGEQYPSAAVFTADVQDITLLNIHYTGPAGAMIQCDEDSSHATTDVTIAFCSSYGARIASRIPSDSLVMGCRFELPTTSTYDRIDSSHGSSHALYMFAGRWNMRVIGNHFENIRENAVKFSGSGDAVCNGIVANNTFQNCYKAAVMWGADDVQDHSSVVIEGNNFYNCVVNGSDAVIGILGSRAVNISKNNFYWDTPSNGSFSAKYGIQVSRYFNGSTWGQPVESVIIEGNIFEVRIGAGYVSDSAQNILSAIDLYNIGYGTVSTAGRHYAGGVQVRGNHIAVGSTGMTLTGCIEPLITDNVFSNVPTPLNMTGCRMPTVHGNVCIQGNNFTNGAQIIQNGCSWPIYFDNFMSGRHSTGLFSSSVLGTKTWAVSDNNGSGIVDYPLLGVRGKVATADGKSEVVFAYGYGWQDGDTISVAGTTFTYKGTSPNGTTEFNSAAGLITLIDGVSNIDAADYGAPWSITTNHIRVRKAAAGTSGFQVQPATTRRTAGVVLPNGGTGGSAMLCNAMGGQVTGSHVVVWSQAVDLKAAVSLIPLDSASAGLMASAGYYEVARNQTNDGVACEMEVGTTAGTESWRWALR